MGDYYDEPENNDCRCGCGGIADGANGYNKFCDPDAPDFNQDDGVEK